MVKGFQTLCPQVDKGKIFFEMVTAGRIKLCPIKQEKNTHPFEIVKFCDCITVV